MARTQAPLMLEWQKNVWKQEKDRNETAGVAKFECVLMAWGTLTLDPLWSTNKEPSAQQPKQGWGTRAQGDRWWEGVEGGHEDLEPK